MDMRSSVDLLTLPNESTMNTFFSICLYYFVSLFGLLTRYGTSMQTLIQTNLASRMEKVKQKIVHRYSFGIKLFLKSLEQTDFPQLF